MTPENTPVPSPLIASFIGNGAIGSLLAAQCDRVNLPYDMWWRYYSEDPLTVKMLDGGSEVLSASVPHATELLVIATKAWQVKDAVQQYKDRLLPQACVVLLHNGAGTEDWVLAELKTQSVLRMTTSKAALKQGDFLVQETGEGATQAGWLRIPEKDRKHQLEAWCERLLPDCQWFEDIRLPIWQKLAVNSIINPLTALENINNGGLLLPKYKAIIDRLIGEFITLCDASKIPLNKQQITTLVWEVIEKTAVNYSSMHQDIANSRPTEIDYINGFLVNSARRLSLSLPTNEDLVSGIKALELDQS